jgi:hypothetical protein
LEILVGIGEQKLSNEGYPDLIDPPVRIPCLSIQCGSVALKRDVKKQLPSPRDGP